MLKVLSVTSTRNTGFSYIATCLHGYVKNSRSSTNCSGCHFHRCSSSLIVSGHCWFPEINRFIQPHRQKAKCGGAASWKYHMRTGSPKTTPSCSSKVPTRCLKTWGSVPQFADQPVVYISHTIKHYHVDTLWIKKIQHFKDRTHYGNQLIHDWPL